MLVDGREQDQISVLDRGLHYGDGFFETVAVVSGKPGLWSLHEQRMRDSAKRLKLQIANASDFLADLHRLAGSDSCVIKFIVTRGAGGRGYRVPQQHQSTRIAIRYDWPDYPGEYSSNGIEAIVCKTRLCHNPALAGIKHLNRLENVIARSEWTNQDIPEGIMLDQEDNIVEGTMTNIFIEKNGDTLLTPKLNRCGVAGIQRSNLILLAKAIGIDVVASDISVESITDNVQLFVCNSLIGIWPIRKIGNRNFRIGKLTLTLQDKLAQQP
jgi:4-amino-4-deoxychorismate lyase